jgi:hypothetical protein
MERVSRRLERGKGREKKFRSDVKVLAEGEKGFGWRDVRNSISRDDIDIRENRELLGKRKSDNKEEIKIK